MLLAAYFGHLLIGATVASVSVAHLTQRGIAPVVAGTMLSIEALMQMAGRTVGGLIGDRIDPRYLLMVALLALVVGSAALSVANDYPTMLLYAVGSGLGFGLTLLAVTVLLLNYYGRKHNLEIFSITCLIGAVSALGPTIGGGVRDLTGSFASTFQIFAGVIAVILVAVVFMRPPRQHRLEAIPPTIVARRSSPLCRSRQLRMAGPCDKHEFGVFLPVANGGWIISSTTPPLDGAVEQNLDAAVIADEVGMDFVMSMGKWRGFGGVTNHWGVRWKS